MKMQIFRFLKIEMVDISDANNQDGISDTTDQDGLSDQNL